MSNDEVKKFLLRAWNVNHEREEDFERIQRLRSQLTKVTTSYSGTPGGGGNNDKLGTMIAMIASMEADYRNHMAEYYTAVKEIETVINTLSSRSHRRVLKMRYLDFYKWEDIAAKMSYDIRHVTRLHHEALEELSKTI